MYQLGKIAEKEGDSVAALNYFKTVAEKHHVESIRNEAKKKTESTENS